MSLSVDWLERAKVKVIKVDSIANAKLPALYSAFTGIRTVRT